MIYQVIALTILLGLATVFAVLAYLARRKRLQAWNLIIASNSMVDALNNRREREEAWERTKAEKFI